MLSSLSVSRLRLLIVDTERSLSDWSYPDCAAPFWRVYWNEKGRGIIGYQGRDYLLEGRNLLLISPETHFSAEAASPMDHLYIHFLAGPPYDRPKPGIAVWKAGKDEVEELAALARAADSESQSGAAAVVQSAATEAQGAAAVVQGAAPEVQGAALLASALCYRMLARFPQELLAPAAGQETARSVEELVLARLAERLSNEELAKRLGASIPTIERRLRLETGRSLHVYVLELKIREACFLLRHSEESVEEIAEALGFTDRSHFSRAFASFRGLSPAAYRASPA
jgi:AraC-like DNA-binding protein